MYSYYDPDVDRAAGRSRDEDAGLYYDPIAEERKIVEEESYWHGEHFPDNEFYKGVQNYRKLREDNGYVLAVTLMNDYDFQYATWQVNQYGRGLDYGHYFMNDRKGALADYRKRAELDVVDVASILSSQGLMDENTFTFICERGYFETHWVTLDIINGDIAIRQHEYDSLLDKDSVTEVYNSVDDLDHTRPEIRDLVNRKVNDLLAELYPANYDCIKITDCEGNEYPEYRKFYSNFEMSQYEKWLNKLVTDEFGENKKCEVYWAYDSIIDPQTMQTAIDNADEYNGSVYDSIYEHIYEQWNMYDYDSEQLGKIESEIENSDNDLFKAIHNKEQDKFTSLSEYLYSKTRYKGVDLNLDELLKQSEFKVNFLLSTEQELNHDLGSIVNCFGNSYLNAETDRLNEVDFDNSLVYLIHQQGHTVKEVYDVMLNDKNTDSPFIRSVVDEINNMTGGIRCSLTLLAKLNGKEMVDYYDNIKDDDYLSFGKSCMLGLYDEDNGAGSLLEIELEKDFVFPKSMVHVMQIEGAPRQYRYTVDQSYGLIGSAWAAEYGGKTDTEPTLRKENIAETLANAQELILDNTNGRN